MKRFLVLFFILLSTILVSKSQTFALSDSIVQQYDMLRVYHIQFYLGKGEIFPNSYPFLDSLADFLNKHQEINTMKTEEEKNAAHYKNRRIEFVIMEMY